MDKENLDYLEGIKNKVIEYDDIRSDVLGYVLENEINDLDLVTDLFVIGFLWQAHRRKEILTDEDIIMMLDSEEDIGSADLEEYRAYFLDETHHNLTLEELLDLTVESNED